MYIRLNNYTILGLHLADTPSYMQTQKSHKGQYIELSTACSWYVQETLIYLYVLNANEDLLVADK